MGGVLSLPMVSISIIIPVLNEGLTLKNNLYLLNDLLDHRCEVIVVDGGSTDSTVEIAAQFADILLESKSKGRAAQMNAGAEVAKGKILLFSHSDTHLPSDFSRLLNTIPEQSWGFFPLKLSGEKWAFRVIEKFINIRSKLSSVATGDQSIFIGKKLFHDYSGYANIPLMEDVEIAKRLRKQQAPIIPPSYVITSSRRWEKRGIMSTILLMWCLRLSYFLGVSPEFLAKKYYK